MNSLRAQDYCRCVFTAVVVPAVEALLCFGSLPIFQLYLRAGISLGVLNGVYIVAMMIMALGVFWVASRAVLPKPGDVVGIAFGLVISAALAVAMRYDLFSDLGLLFAMLVCTYLVGLVVAVRGSLVA